MLLCERCGYVLDGSPRDGPCPECGKPVRDSLPEFRPDTPWQQKPGVKAWLATAILLLDSPRRLFVQLRVGTDARSDLQAAMLIVVNCLLAVVPLALLLLVGVPNRLAIDAAILCGCLVILTLIEAVGLSFIASRRNWRVPRRLARSICAHASLGWCITVPVMGFLALAETGIGVLIPKTLAMLPYWWPLGFGLLAGMLYFQTLAYLGVRACKYANADVGATVCGPPRD